MKTLFMILVVLIVSIFIGIKIAEDPGLMMLSYGHWTIEMPLWFAAISALLLFFVGYLLLQLFNDIDFSVYRFRQWLQWRRKNKSFSKTNRGLVELLEGDWQNAEYYLQAGVHQSDSPLVSYLASAKAAHELQTFDKRDAYLRKAYEAMPHAELAIGLVQAQFQVDGGQNEQALVTLKRLRSLAPKHRFVLMLLEKIYIRLGDWRELLELLPTLKKMRVITTDQYPFFEANIYQQLIIDAKQTDVNTLQILWRNLPKKLQLQPLILKSYIYRLRKEGVQLGDDLASLVAKSLKTEWNLELIKCYGLVTSSDPVAQLTKAESFLSDHSDVAELFLTLGRLSERCQLWGKAKDYFKISLKLRPTTETYCEYGKLLESLNEFDLANKNYRLSVLADPI
jgi:HemY protein